MGTSPKELRKKIDWLDAKVGKGEAVKHGAVEGLAIVVASIAGGPAIGAIIAGGIGIYEIVRARLNRLHQSELHTQLFTRLKQTPEELAEEVIGFFDEPGVVRRRTGPFY